jgi:hypothetical protein
MGTAVAARLMRRTLRLRLCASLRGYFGQEVAPMRRIYWYPLLMLMLAARPSSAIQLQWSSGSHNLTFASATRCTLVVQADSAEVRLPSEWRLLWVADSSSIQFVAMDSLEACLLDEAQVSRIEGPATAADSVANMITERFCSTGSNPAVAAKQVLDLPEGGHGKFKAVAPDPADSTAVLESNEVTFNGGVSDPYPPAVLRAYITHPGADLSVTAIGAGLARTSAMSLTPGDASWRLPLALSERSDNHAVATAYLGIPMPICHLDVAGESDTRGTAALLAETPPAQMAPVGSSAKFVPAYGIIQPKDFAFYYQQQLGVFHVFYIVNNQVIAHKPGYGADSTEKCIGHAWSTDLQNWHNMDSILTVRSNKWDNFHIWAPTIVQKDLQFKLFYTGVQLDIHNNPIQRIGLATADATLPFDSLKTWTRRDSAVFSCGQVPWANKNTSLYQGRQFRDPFVMADPDSVGRYLMYYVTIPRDQTTKMVVGAARSVGDLSAWRNYGPLHSTEQQYTGTTDDIVESPHLIEHRDVVTGTTSRWLFMTTNTQEEQNMHFQRTLQSPTDTLAANWLPTTDLYTYLGGDSTVYYWHATEYLAVPASIGGYATTHEFITAYDDSTWAIDINEILWNANPQAPYYADFTIAYPSLAAVEPPGSKAYNNEEVRLLLLGQQPGVGEARVAVDLPAPMQAEVAVMDIQGRKVRTMARGPLPAGRTTATWDGRGVSGEPVPSGVYFVRLTCQGHSRTARLVLLR